MEWEEGSQVLPPTRRATGCSGGSLPLQTPPRCPCRAGPPPRRCTHRWTRSQGTCLHIESMQGGRVGRGGRGQAGRQAGRQGIAPPLVTHRQRGSVHEAYLHHSDHPLPSLTTHPHPCMLTSTRPPTFLLPPTHPPTFLFSPPPTHPPPARPPAYPPSYSSSSSPSSPSASPSARGWEAGPLPPTQSSFTTTCGEADNREHGWCRRRWAAPRRQGQWRRSPAGPPALLPDVCGWGAQEQLEGAGCRV